MLRCFRFLYMWLHCLLLLHMWLRCLLLHMWKHHMHRECWIRHEVKRIWWGWNVETRCKFRVCISNHWSVVRAIELRNRLREKWRRWRWRQRQLGRERVRSHGKGHLGTRLPVPRSMPILMTPPAALPIKAPTVLLPVPDTATIAINISIATGIVNANATANRPPASSIVPAKAVGMRRETPVLVASGAAIAPMIRRVRRGLLRDSATPLRCGRSARRSGAIARAGPRGARISYRRRYSRGFGRR